MNLSNVAVTILVNTASVSHRCLPGGIIGLFASSPFCDVSFVSAHLVQPAVSDVDKEAEKPEAHGPGGGPDRPAHLEEGRGFMEFSQKEVAEQLTRLDAVGVTHQLLNKNQGSLVVFTPPYALIVRCTSWHLKIAPCVVSHLILAVTVVYGEWVNLVMVSTWHLVL